MTTEPDGDTSKGPSVLLDMSATRIVDDVIERASRPGLLDRRRTVDFLEIGSHRRARFGLLQHPDDLFFVKSLLHGFSPAQETLPYGLEQL